MLCPDEKVLQKKAGLMAEAGLAVNATGTASDNEAAEDAAAGNVAKNAAATDPEPN